MTNRRASALLELVDHYHPDVLITFETDKWWQSQLDRLQSDMPCVMRCPQDNLYGMHIYSRLPIEQPKIEYLVEADVPSFHAVITLRCGQAVRLHVLHPKPPSPTENEHSSPRDAELLVVARSLAKNQSPAIVVGDLNDVPWSHTAKLFRKTSGMLNPRIGRRLLNTFHAGLPFLRWPLDHLYHSPHFQLIEMHRLPSIGSDHFPLFVSLLLTSTERKEQMTTDLDHREVSQTNALLEDHDVDETDVPTPDQNLNNC